MSTETVVLKEHSNSYDIFILVLTIMSLAIMGLLRAAAGRARPIDILRFYDNAICVVFLVDFFGNVAGAHPKNAYLVGRRGWLDLLGSIPSLGFIPAAGLFRLFRISRLARVSRMLRGSNREALIKDVLDNRGQYAIFITILSAFMVLTVSTVLMVQFESKSPDANITSGADALWWGFTTITTVGYGDTVSSHVPGACHGGPRDVRRRRDHRLPRQHPGQHPGATTEGASGTRRGGLDTSVRTGPSRRRSRRRAGEHPGGAGGVARVAGRTVTRA